MGVLVIFRHEQVPLDGRVSRVYFFQELYAAVIGKEKLGW
jgi:hypothetical protein